MNNTQIAIFKGKKIRKTIHNDEWWFSVVDVVQTLTDQLDNYTARKYWNKLAQRLREEGSEVVTFCHRLKLQAPDGKMRETDCSNTEEIFPLKKDATDGGSVAGRTRKDIESQTGKQVSNKNNFLPPKKRVKKLK